VYLCFLFATVLFAPTVASAALPDPGQLYYQDGWTLAVQGDVFAGRTRCMLTARDHRLTYQPGALGFRLGARRDVLDAIYRLDGGAPHRWQDRYPALVAAQIPVDGPRVDDSFGGVAWLPLSDLRTVRTVEMRAGDATQVQRFELRGFWPMLDAARRLGCPLS
jgi:hypothetical protein